MEAREALEQAFEEAETRETDAVVEKTQPEEVAEAVEESTEESEEESSEEESSEDTEEETKEAPEEEKPEKAEEAEESEEQEEVDEAPSSWRKEEAAKFNELPKDIRDYIKVREDQMHRGLDMYKADANKARSIEKVFEPFDDYLKQVGATREQAVMHLLQAEKNLRTSTPEMRLAHFQKLAYDYGIDPAQLSELPPLDPRVAQLESQLSQVQMAQLQQNAQQHDDTTYEELAAFGASHEFFDDVRNDMADLLETGKAADLESAYTKACRLNDNVYERLQERTRQEASRTTIQQKKQAAEKAKSAAVSVKGSPAGQTEETPKDIRAALEAAFDGLQ